MPRFVDVHAQRVKELQAEIKRRAESAPQEFGYEDADSLTEDAKGDPALQRRVQAHIFGTPPTEWTEHSRELERRRQEALAAGTDQAKKLAPHSKTFTAAEAAGLRAVMDEAALSENPREAGTVGVRRFFAKTDPQGYATAQLRGAITAGEMDGDMVAELPGFRPEAERSPLDSLSVEELEAEMDRLSGKGSGSGGGSR